MRGVAGTARAGVQCCGMRAGVLRGVVQGAGGEPAPRGARRTAARL